MNEALMKDTLKGSLIDNYVLTYYSDFVKKADIRIEKTFNHPITYGVALRTPHNSSVLRCFRRYVVNHPQVVFEIIAEHVKALKVRLSPFDRIV